MNRFVLFLLVLSVSFVVYAGEDEHAYDHVYLKNGSTIEADVVWVSFSPKKNTDETTQTETTFVHPPKRSIIYIDKSGVGHTVSTDDVDEIQFDVGLANKTWSHGYCVINGSVKLVLARVTRVKDEIVYGEDHKGVSFESNACRMCLFNAKYRSVKITKTPPPELRWIGAVSVYWWLSEYAGYTTTRENLIQVLGGYKSASPELYTGLTEEAKNKLDEHFKTKGITFSRRPIPRTIEDVFATYLLMVRSVERGMPCEFPVVVRTQDGTRILMSRVMWGYQDGGNSLFSNMLNVKGAYAKTSFPVIFTTAQPGEWKFYPHVISSVMKDGVEVIGDVVCDDDETLSSEPFLPVAGDTGITGDSGVTGDTGVTGDSGVTVSPVSQKSPVSQVSQKSQVADAQKPQVTDAQKPSIIKPKIGPYSGRDKGVMVSGKYGDPVTFDKYEKGHARGGIGRSYSLRIVAEVPKEVKVGDKPNPYKKYHVTNSKSNDKVDKMDVKFNREHIKFIEDWNAGEEMPKTFEWLESSWRQQRQIEENERQRDNARREAERRAALRNANSKRDALKNKYLGQNK